MTMSWLRFQQAPLRREKNPLAVLRGSWRRRQDVAERLEHLIDLYLAPGYSSELIRVFVASGLKKSRQSLEFDEDIEVFKASLGEVLEMIKRGEIRDAKTVSAILYYFFLARDGSAQNP